MAQTDAAVKSPPWTGTGMLMLAFQRLAMKGAKP